MCAVDLATGWRRALTMVWWRAEKGCAQMQSNHDLRSSRPNRALVKWGVALALLAVLVGGSLFLRSAMLTAHADAYTGRHGVQQATEGPAEQ